MVGKSGVRGWRGELSIAEYIRFICANNSQKDTLKKLGNRNDAAEENECDDTDAGKYLYKRFWNIPTYERDWQERLTLELTSDEAAFLKEQIIKTCGDTMLGYIIKNNLNEVTDIEFFSDIESGLIGNFPYHVREDYLMAMAFSDFVYALRVLFNIIVSDDQNADANQAWEKIKKDLGYYADAMHVDEIFERLSLTGNTGLRHFLKQAQGYMQNHDVKALKECIIKREVQLKGVNRAKTKHPGEFDTTAWFGGGHLDYRFNNAKVIIKDIFEGVNHHAES